MNSTVFKIYSLICGFPKTVLLNFYYFNIRTAIHFPILVSGNTKIESLGGRTAIKISNPHFGCLRFGFSGGSFNMRINRGGWSIKEGGELIIKNGNVHIGMGSGLYIGTKGKIFFNGRFFCNSNCLFVANKQIFFGDDVLIGWKCKIIDGDGHKIKYKNIGSTKKREITIGNHVWICSESTLLKGVEIGNGSVVAMNSHITKSFGENLLIAGNHVAREGVDWEH